MPSLAAGTALQIFRPEEQMFAHRSERQEREKMVGKLGSSVVSCELACGADGPQFGSDERLLLLTPRQTKCSDAKSLQKTK